VDIGDADVASASAATRVRVRAVVFALSGLVFLIALLWFAGLGHVMDVLRNADPILIAAAMLTILVATIIGAINSYMVAATGTGIHFISYLGVYWLTWAVGQVIPGQVGDLIGMSLFLRRRGLALPAAVGRLSIDKLVSLFCTLALSGGLLAIFDAAIPRIAGFVGACAAALLLLAFIFASRRPAFTHRSEGWIAQFMSGLREAHHVAITRPRIVLLDGFLTILKLAVIGLCYWIVLQALHTHTNGLFDVTVIANSAGLIAYIPLSANGVGTVETGSVYLFGQQGVTAPVVLAMYLILRFANLLLAWTGAVFVLALSWWRKDAPSAHDNLK
jgi:uncharacterized membrane protein YbhN (UPF0104 family)